MNMYRPCSLFVFPTNLHCSQTTNKRNNLKSEFVFPTNLHCSQTMLLFNVSNHVFVFPTNLHCSQTQFTNNRVDRSLFSLRIYTALKRLVDIALHALVCFPYEFTLLSNLKSSKNNILQNTRVPS